MDLLKIFRMQEPVPKDLLSKNSEVGKYKEVVQEKDILLKNCKARIRELEQQVIDLETKNREFNGIQIDHQGQKLINEYESFYQKIMTESERVIAEKNQMEAQFKELEIFCQDLLEKYDKAKNVIYLYENDHEKLKGQIIEYEKIISSLTEEFNKLKECEHIHKKVDDTESKFSLKQHRTFEEPLIKNQIQKEYCKSMFEPLKGLDN